MQNYKSFDFLKTFTTIYLVLPVLLFIVFWFRFIVALPLILISGLFIFFNRKSFIKTRLYIALSKKQIVFMIMSLLVIFVWVYFSGIGGFAPQNWDYGKHNELIHDLYYNQWPVRYEGQGNLIYYVAFYLIPVGISKLIGLQFVNVLFLMFFYCGIVLFYFWISRYLGRFSILPVLIFILWGGFHYFGYLLVQGKMFPIGDPYVDSWLNGCSGCYFYGLSYQAFTCDFYYAPQIGVSGILVPIYIIWQLRENSQCQLPYLYVSCLPLWCPFIFIGVIPFIVYYLIKSIFRTRRFFNSLNPFTLLTCSVIFLALFIYIISNSQSSKDSSTLFQYFNSWKDFALIIFFYTIEFGVVAVYIWIFRDATIDICLLVISVISLMFIPFVIIGMYDDFAMRVSIPGLTVLYVLFCQTLFSCINKTKTRKNIVAIILACLIIINMAPSAINDILRSFWYLDYSSFPEYNASIIDDELSYQYVSPDFDNPYEKFLSR